jgi:uncharacterized membrane protein (DUF4010 family)
VRPVPPPSAFAQPAKFDRSCTQLPRINPARLLTFISKGDVMTLTASTVALRLVLSIGIGLLVGFEREWSRKDLGVRIFAITTLLGTLSALLAPSFALAAMGAVALLIVFVNGRNLIRGQNLEITTSVSLFVTLVLGALVGEGYLFAPVAASILLTLLLSLKVEFTTFAGGLRPEEIRSAVFLGLLGFVVRPVLPNRFLDPWQIFNPREAWVTIMVVAGIGFVNYVLLRIYGSRGLYFTALLGGLVNSTATVSELSTRLAAGDGLMALAVPVVLLTTAAMLVRNLLILVLFSPRAAPIALWPMLAMAAGAVYMAWRRRDRTPHTTGELPLSSPISLPKILTFGMFFLLIAAIGTVGARFLGKYGFLIVSLFGGLVSSASTTAAAANLSSHGKLSAQTAAVAAILTSAASALVNLPVVYRQTRRKEETRTLSALSFALVLIGLAVLLIRERLWLYLR